MGALLRHPLALLGALTIIAQFRELLTLQHDLAAVIEALQTVTRPIWTSVFGWLHISAPEYVKDYCSVGLVFAGMLTRQHHHRWALMRRKWNSVYDYKYIQWMWPSPTIPLSASTPVKYWLLAYPLFLIQDFLFWPYYLARRTYQFAEHFSEQDRDEDAQNSFRDDVVYLETFFFIIIILLVNYALIYAT